MTTAEPKRKLSPMPLLSSTEAGAPPRALSPVRRAVVPFGIFGVLSLGAAAALVATSGDAPGPTTSKHGNVRKILDALDDLGQRFIDPPESTGRVAGGISAIGPFTVPPPTAASAPAPAISASATAPTPTAASRASTPKAIHPPAHPPKLAGK